MNSITNRIDSDRLIITAASRSYGPSLLALLGSLNLNWSQHPPVLVYDIGLDEKTLCILKEHNIPVKKVPPFCPHWRKHFTWKLWCWNDAPARNIIWMDAGLVVLQPMDEIFDFIEQSGYFVCSTYHSLVENASEAACIGCGVDSSFRNGKITLACTLIGLRNQGIVYDMVKEALSVALAEEYIAATKPLHRHDQAIMSLLMFKHLGKVITKDDKVYMTWESPRHIEGQKIWIHRRSIRNEDLSHYVSHISMPGRPYLPQPSSSWQSKIPLFLIRRWLSSFHKGFIYDGVRD